MGDPVVIPNTTMDEHDINHASVDLGTTNNHRSLGREAIENHLRQKIFVVQHSSLHAGQPIRQSERTAYQRYADDAINHASNIYAPFTSRMEWELARWAKLRSPSSTAFTDLLKIEGVITALLFIYFK